MKLKFSVNIEAIYSELPFEERFAAAKKDGFNYVEMWGWEDKNLEQVKKLLADNELTLTNFNGDGPFSMCNPQTKTQYLEHLKRAVEAARFMGLHTLGIHSDSLQEWPQYAMPLPEDYSYTMKICTMFDILKTIAPWGEEADITFVLEPLNTVKDHVGNFLEDPRTAAELGILTGSDRIKVLYDAYHMYMNEGKIVEQTQKYLDRIGYIHIADAPGRHEPGTGVINYGRYFDFLAEAGYDKVIAFELYPETDTKKAVAAIKEACGIHW